jgi:hypothetical protein
MPPPNHDGFAFFKKSDDWFKHHRHQKTTAKSSTIDFEASASSPSQRFKSMWVNGVRSTSIEPPERNVQIISETKNVTNVVTNNNVINNFAAAGSDRSDKDQSEYPAG